MTQYGIESVVAIVSGGLDSSTMMWDLEDKGIKIKEILSFDYGQRHKKELQHVISVVNLFKESFYPVSHKIVDVSSINSLIWFGVMPLIS